LTSQVKMGKTTLREGTGGAAVAPPGSSGIKALLLQVTEGGLDGVAGGLLHAEDHKSFTSDRRLSPRFPILGADGERLHTITHVAGIDGRLAPAIGAVDLRFASMQSYPFPDNGVLVTACGRICNYRKNINFTTARAGRRVGIKEVDSGIWITSCATI
jgi:hypothetical protein